MLSGMAGGAKSGGDGRRRSDRGTQRARSSEKARPPASSSKHDAHERSFPAALAELLRSRKIAVPKGLPDAPAEAYASQPASFVEQLQRLPDAELKRFAEKVAGFTARQQERARAEWERSPLIAELRRRKLKEPPRPLRNAGVSVSLAKPLSEWSDAELVKAANEWSRLGRA
jgi:hypothetical protein